MTDIQNNDEQYVYKPRLRYQQDIADLLMSEKYSEQELVTKQNFVDGICVGMSVERVSVPVYYAPHCGYDPPSELITKARNLAKEHHKYRARDTLPSYVHSFRVAESVIGEDAKCVALLHHVLTDSKLNGFDLVEEGFPWGIVEPLMILTRGPKGTTLIKNSADIPYLSWIRQIKDIGNSLATEVKVADMIDNLSHGPVLLQMEALIAGLAILKNVNI